MIFIVWLSVLNLRAEGVQEYFDSASVNGVERRFKNI
jgi:hypothetical protein